MGVSRNFLPVMPQPQMDATYQVNRLHSDKKFKGIRSYEYFMSGGGAS